MATPSQPLVKGLEKGADAAISRSFVGAQSYLRASKIPAVSSQDEQLVQGMRFTHPCHLCRAIVWQTKRPENGCLRFLKDSD